MDELTPVLRAAAGVRTLVETLKKMGFSEAKNCDKETLVDLLTLASFAIDILPKGKRPVAMEYDSEWQVMDNETGDLFATDEDYKLFQHWLALDRLKAAAAR